MHFHEENIVIPRKLSKFDYRILYPFIELCIEYNTEYTEHWI